MTLEKIAFSLIQKTPRSWRHSAIALFFMSILPSPGLTNSIINQPEHDISGLSQLEQNLTRFLTQLESIPKQEPIVKPHELAPPQTRQTDRSLEKSLVVFKEKLNIALKKKQATQPPLLLDTSSTPDKKPYQFRYADQINTKAPLEEISNIMGLYGFVDNIPDASPPAEKPTPKQKSIVQRHDLDLLPLDLQANQATHNLAPISTSSGSLSTPSNRFNPNFDPSSPKSIRNYIAQNRHHFSDQEQVLSPKMRQSYKGIWVLVDSYDQVIYIMKNDQPIKTMENASFGRNGTTWFKIRDDEKTPLGEYRINWINRKSQYHLFFGLDYPSIGQIDYAYQKGLLDHETYEETLTYFKRYRNPPQTTLLGGNIGIHGIGNADREIHEQFNWTRGCIALTNQQIDTLSKYIRIGTPVVIK
mgnify:CR=1 FL=1